MGDRKSNFNRTRVREIIHFIRNYQKLNLQEQSVYLNRLKQKDLSIIHEIFLNFLKKNIKLKRNQLKILHTFKKFIYTIVSGRRSVKYKLNILPRGHICIQVLKIILPATLKLLTEFQ